MVYLSKNLPKHDLKDSIDTIYALDFYPEKEDFEEMTVTKLVEMVRKTVEQADNPVILLGSSHGGMVALSYLSKYSGTIAGLVLFAPLLKPIDSIKIFFKNQLEKWPKKGYIEIDHSKYEGKTTFRWSYIEDLEQYPDLYSLKLDIPILLIHGQADDVVPVSWSKQFVSSIEANGGDITSYFPKNGQHNLNNQMKNLERWIINWIQSELI